MLEMIKYKVVYQYLENKILYNEKIELLAKDHDSAKWLATEIVTSLGYDAFFVKDITAC